MQDVKNLKQFEEEWRRCRIEMEQAISQVEGNAFIVANLAMQYAVRSLQLQQYSSQQIEDLMNTLLINKPQSKLN
jgi:ABC-type Zn uptake system ZnuABC Zn-binding protein ZnuA